jgi:hypothetical protein
VATLHFENWDGVTAPALPSGWTTQSGSGIVTATGSGPVVPISSPNMIEAPGPTFSPNTITWGTQDGVGGNVQVTGTGLFNGGVNNASFAIFARSNASTTLYSSSTFYEAAFSGSGDEIAVSKYVSGTGTFLFGVSAATISSNTWYQLVFTLNGTTISLSAQRLSDSYWLNGVGVWQPAMVTAISFSDSSITGQGYAGWSAESPQPVYGDNWTLASLSAPAIPPNAPLVVYFPRQYYPLYAE